MTTKEIELHNNSMGLLDFIGFIFAFIFVFFIFFKKKMDDRKRMKDPAEHARRKQEKEHTLEEFLASLNEENEEEVETLPTTQKVIPPKPPTPIDFSFNPAGSYEVKRRAHIGRGTALVKGLKSRRDLLIIQEIMDVPLSMRKPKF